MTDLLRKLVGNPDLEPTFEDIQVQAIKLHTACMQVVLNEHAPNNGSFYDNEADIAEELVIMLMRFHRNEKMMSLVADELARAIKKGW